MRPGGSTAAPPDPGSSLGSAAARRGPLRTAILVALLSIVPPGAPAQERQRTSIEALEARTVDLVNTHRRSAKLPPLPFSRPVTAVARRHSEAMAAGRVPFSHDGFDRRRREIERSVPLQGMAENVGVNTSPARRTVATAVSGWLRSAGHRENIEGNYDVTGVGIARGPRGTWYFTQIFVKRRAHPRAE